MRRVARAASPATRACRPRRFAADDRSRARACATCPDRSSPRRSRRCRPPARNRPRLRAPDTLLHRAQARRIDRERPLAASRSTSATLSPGCGALAVRRVRGGLARHRERAPSNPADARIQNASPSVGASAPLDAAVVPEHAEDGVAARQIRIARCRCTRGQRPCRLAQHEEPSGVIDLPIHQHDAGDGGVARARAPAAAPGSPAAA